MLSILISITASLSNSTYIYLQCVQVIACQHGPAQQRETVITVKMVTMDADAIQSVILTVITQGAIRILEIAHSVKQRMMMHAPSSVHRTVIHIFVCNQQDSAVHVRKISGALIVPIHALTVSMPATKPLANVHLAKKASGEAHVTIIVL